MSEQTKADRPWRDPWKLSIGLVVLIGILALVFPKPETVDEDAPRELYQPPPGYTPTTQLDLSDTRCLKKTGIQEDCRLMGAQDGQIIHLFVQWDFTELQRRPGSYEIVDAWVELLENHQDQYEGAVSMAPADRPDELPTASPMLIGGRQDNRTLRLPSAGHSPELSALIAGWLNETALNRGVWFMVPADNDSSIDEFTPTLRFAYRIVE
ncbi:MAG: hypothetical protein AAFV53_19855 [Myxococcota bacterium]